MSFVSLLTLACSYSLRSPALQQQPALHVVRRALPPVARAGEGVSLAVDDEGTPIWDLRVATATDTDAISRLSKGLLPSDVVTALMSSGHCLVGESGGKMVSAALVHSFNTLKDKEKGLDGGLVQSIELVSVLA